MIGKEQVDSDGQLGFFEATSIIAGYGIGGGILALPWLVSLNGVLPSLAILSAAYLFSLLLHLMIAEVSAGDESGNQIVELFRKHLFTGRIGAALTWLFFGVMGIIFFANLAAYVAGGGEVLASVGVGVPWGSILFYAAAAFVAIFGLKTLGIAEKWAVIGMGVLFVGLVIMSVISISSTGPAIPAKPPAPGFFRLLALAVIIRERLGISRFASWLISTLPTLAIALSGAGGFMKFMRTAGGGIAVFVAVLVIPTYKKYRRSREGTVILNSVLSSPHWGWVVMIAYLAMAAGSVVSID